MKEFLPLRQEPYMCLQTAVLSQKVALVTYLIIIIIIIIITDASYSELFYCLFFIQYNMEWSC